MKRPKITDANTSTAASPSALAQSLQSLVAADIRLSVMIWGPPGVGKSSIVAQVAQTNSLALMDLRLSQLAPTDLRGLPVAAGAVARWLPPEFLPTEGNGVLFLDEINMAPPAIQGIAQQLILDRRVGSYQVPPGWFVWAAGNREEDRASVFEMPAPLANRFVHFEIQPDFDSFRQHALERGIDEAILSFLAFRPGLLHRPDDKRPAWPSPRSWFMASQLHRAGIRIDPAVGQPAADEFEAYCHIYGTLPDLDRICAGESTATFPEDPSSGYAVTIGLSTRARDVAAAGNALRWMLQNAPGEWQSAFVSDLLVAMRAAGLAPQFAAMLREDATLRQTLADLRELLVQ